MQVLSVVTVGNDQDGLSLETALGLETSNFISHFTCPSFAINEVCLSSRVLCLAEPNTQGIHRVGLYEMLSVCSCGLGIAVTVWYQLPCDCQPGCHVLTQMRGLCR